MPKKNSEKDLLPDVNNDHTISRDHDMESLVQEQIKRFQVIASSKNDAIITSDESKRILFWNKGAEYIFGYSSEEAIGQPLTLIIPQPLHQRHEEGIERMNQRKGKGNLNMYLVE